MIRLALAGLRHYRGVHAMVVAGVAVAVAVLAGALIVGASVRASLRDLALARLGNTHTVVSSHSYFRESLGPTPLVAMTGAVVHDDTGRTAARVQVFGINDAFMRFHGLEGNAPRGREAWISEALARELQAQPGAPLILRIAKPSDIPLGTVQGRREDAGERIRLSVARIADRRSLGDFSLVPAQGPALTLLVPLERLQRDLQLDGRVNALLVGADGGDPAAVQQELRKTAQLDDYGLTLRPSPDRRTIVIDSRAGILRTPVVEVIRGSATGPEAVLVHLANVIRVGTREIPYSLVAGRESVPVGVWLNQWAADDLGAKPSDPVTLDYFVWSDEAGLTTRSTTLEIAGVVPMSAEGGDPTFTPAYPGLTDAEDVSGWDPPFPVDLTRVRKKDEEYWDTWRSAPKAFLPLQTAQALWGTAHGNVSSVRVPVPAGLSPEAFSDQLTRAIAARLDPVTAGFEIRPARADALAAAEGTTDFGEYFVYFSFFLVVAGLLLAALFFALGIEQRHREIGILAATGFTARDIRRLLVAEAGVLALLGSVAGVAGAIGYAALIMYGLRTWWVDAVGTTALSLHLDWLLLIGGAAGALVAATASLALSLRSALARTPRALLAGAVSDAPATTQRRTWPVTGIVAAMAALAMIAAARAGMMNQVAGFFGAGGALMIAGLATFGWWLRRAPRDSVARNFSSATSVAAFGAEYARWRPTRSVLSAALITFACFVIVSVGAFRRDPSSLSLDRTLGTGGFVLMAESVAPLMHNPNTATGREELALAADPVLEQMRVSRFRLRPGDEASCLTLYQPRNPRIVAPEAAFLGEQRFTFAESMASTPEEIGNPWLLLNRRFDDGAIPAVADQTTLTYVFHLKVGDDYVFSTDGTSHTRLRIVGALADSVLQSELVIGEPDFVRLFPHREGYGVWMIEAPETDAPALATLLEARLSDLGLDVVETRARLAAYHRVENTYLSTFQALGGLGLLVGTLGLAAVLARNVLERRRELGLLRAVGFTPGHLRTLVLSESLLLVGTGLVLGSMTAIVAVLPALAGRGVSLPIVSLGLLLAAVAGTAVISSIMAARLATAASVVAALKSE